MAPALNIKSRISLQQSLHREILISAIIKVESNCNHLIYNHKEGAAGCLQIRPVMLSHINKVLNSNYSLNDRYDFFKSIEMFEKIMEKSVPSFDLDSVCQFWNAGVLHTNWNLTKQYRDKVRHVYNQKVSNLIEYGEDIDFNYPQLVFTEPNRTNCRVIFIRTYI